MFDPLPSFAAARGRRNSIRSGGTDALRLLDGVGDGAQFAGLIIDDFAGRWLVQTSALGARPPDWLRAVSPAARSVYWKHLDAKDKGAPVHWAGERVDSPFTVQENAVRYRVNFQAGYSQGIFLDQRDNRLAVRQRAAAGGTVLNCFSYTCAFSVAAAAGGSGTVSVDLSRRSLAWGRENFALNGIEAAAGHEFVQGDVFDRLRRFAKQGRRFEGIVLDPPTFSRNREGRVFRAEEDFGGLVELAAPLLAPVGWLLCTTNQRSLTAANFRRMTLAALPRSRHWEIDSAPMPADFRGQPYLQTAWVH